MKNADEYLHAAGVAYVLYFLSVAPFLYVSLVDLAAEWQAASRDESTDYGQHVAMGFLAAEAALPACAFFLMAAAASLYVLWRGSRGQRLRIASWYGALIVILMLGVFGPHSPQFPVRVYFSLYETLLMAPLLILPVFWLWRVRRHYIPSLSR